MSIKEQNLSILKEVKPTKNLEGITDIVEAGYLDSFELMSLIAGISDTFSVEVGIDEIVPENFNSVDAMAAMVEKLKNA